MLEGESQVQIFDLDRYLSERAVFVNEALSRLLAGRETFPERLHAAIHHSVFAGGKRLRPILVLASCEAVGGDVAHAVNTACAFECIHTYSLIHDDLPAMDDADMRRGRPSCHKAYDEVTAILAGDALLTAAFEMITTSPVDDKSLLCSVSGELARAAGYGGMVAGQMVDIESEGKEIDIALLEFIHVHKTGALIHAALKCGAILGGAEASELDRLSGYGEALGLAFQITDDILDVEGSSEEMGKSVGADAESKKATYPALLGLADSRNMVEELTVRAIKALSGFDVTAEPLRAIARHIANRKN